MNRATQEEPKSLSRLLLNVLMSFVNLLVPLFLATVVPTIWTASVIAALVLAVGVTAKTGWQKTAVQLSRWLTGLIAGLACHMFLIFPGYWDVAAFLLVLLVGFSSQASYERYLHLQPALRKHQRRHTTTWPTQTPEDKPIRMLGGPGEIAMGGPPYAALLFPDGVVLQGVGTGGRFSNDGRYFAVQLPSRQRWGLVVLDRHTRRLYRSTDDDAFWEIDEFTDTAEDESPSPPDPNASPSTMFAKFLAQAEAIDLLPVRDLWMEPGLWQECIAVTKLEFPSPDGGQRLTAHIHLPETLQDLDDPLAPLYYPRYTAQMDGHKTTLQVMNQTVVVWRDDAQALACYAGSVDGDLKKSGLWLWQSDKGWQLLPVPWIPGESEPTLTWYDPCALDKHAVRLEASLDFPGLSRQTHGDQIYSIHSDVDIPIGHAPNGRMIVNECPRTSLQLSLPLDSKGERGTTLAQSALLACGLRASLHWLHDGKNGLGAYRYQIGSWEIPGEWLLDHRVSDDGRYLALIRFVDVPQAPGQLMVADIAEQRLLTGPSLLLMRLQSFQAGQISMVEVVGRLKTEALRAPSFSTPLHRFQEPAPPPAQAAGFLAPRDGSRLYYRLRYARLTDQGLSLEPDWRIADQPQAAQADGDFVLPSPGNTDAAWLFGAHTEFDDNWLRPDEARRDGYLLTASGCALSGLTPSMIWSHDSRYLALTRILPERDYHGSHQWQLLILEPETGRLQSRRKPLGCMPLFEQFDQSGLKLRVFKQSWHVPSDTGRTVLLTPNELAALPSTTLIQDSGLSIQADQQDQVPHWLALDAAPLAPWAHRK